MTCPACGGSKPPNYYLCPADWRQLSDAARTALWKDDPQATLRVLELRRQIADGVPLPEIEVTP